MTKLLDSVRATCGAAKTHGAGMFVTMARALVSLFNRLVPKQSKAVLAGFPDMEDSIVELARQIALRRDLAIVVLVDRTRGNLPAKLPTGVIVCRRKSLAGLFHYVTAKYVFFTHGLYLSPRPPASHHRCLPLSSRNPAQAGRSGRSGSGCSSCCRNGSGR